MPTFKVLRRVDAYVDYEAEIEADSPEEAAELASDAPWEFKWDELGATEFDASLFVALDANGDEIDGTQCGKCA